MKKTNFKAADFSAKETLATAAQQIIKGGTIGFIIEDDIMLRGIKATGGRTNIIIDDIMQV
jgi:hypothetical protein